MIEFLVAKKKTVVDTHKRLWVLNGSCTVDMSTVHRWSEGVSGSREIELHDLLHSEHPATAISPDILSRGVVVRVDR